MIDIADDIGGVWRTIGRRRVFIKTGQTLSSAMKESGKFKTIKNKIIEKNKEKEEKIEQIEKDGYIDIENVTFQSEDYGKYIEENDKGRIERFKTVLLTGEDEEIFKYKDIIDPIVLRKEKVNGKWKIYDGQHRYIAYKQLGYLKIPVVFKK